LAGALSLQAQYSARAVRVVSLQAMAFGGHGETVEDTSEFLPAFERALRSGKPAILHVKVAPEAIAPTTTLSAIRQAALRRRGEA